MSPQPLYVSYDMTYTYGAEPGTHYRLSNVAETSYRTSTTPTAADRIHSAHHYAYDPNGNLAYVATGRRRSDGSMTDKMSERKLLWDAQNRLRALSDDGYVSLYWYDTDGDRTVRERHGGEAVWVNSARAGQRTDSVVYSIYPSPYININGDHWTKHYYIGPERVSSSTGKLNAGFGSLDYPGNVVASPGPPDYVNYTAMRHVMEDSIASVYERLGVPYEPQRVGIRGEGEFVSDFPYCLDGEVSVVSIEADMPCEVRVISGQQRQALFDNDPKMAKMDVKILKNLFKMVYARDLDHYRYTARRRYRRLLERCPQVVQMHLLKDIASFLNVTPTYLSKLRRK